VIKRSLLCLAFCLFASAGQAETVRIAAIVNDQVITSSDVDDRRNFILATSEIPATPETQAKLNPRILEALINETLELEEAKRLSIEVTQEEIDDAIGRVEQQRKRPPGSLRAFIKEKDLSAATMEQQLKAQLAWNKVVQRKLKRTVNIAQDEIARAQVAQASAPGVTELRIAALSLPITGPQDEDAVAKTAADLARQLNGGADFITLAQQMVSSGKASLNPPVWVPEGSLQPGMQQALRALQPGQITQPLRSQNTYQLINLIDRRTSKPTADITEVVLKQFTIPAPEKKDKDSLEKMRDLTATIRQNPGSCTDISDAPAGVRAEFLRVTYAQMTPDLRSIVEHLGVTEISEPLLTPAAILMVMPCERIEPATNLPDATKVKNELYSEKLELEAQKYLRNLHRDAFIDIKGE
jgi:peptidyl-prolyl cis-trans isomerase SurA